MKRKIYSKEFKARVALEALKGQKTMSEVASEYAEYTRIKLATGRNV